MVDYNPNTSQCSHFSPLNVLTKTLSSVRNSYILTPELTTILRQDIWIILR